MVVLRKLPSLPRSRTATFLDFMVVREDYVTLHSLNPRNHSSCLRVALRQLGMDEAWACVLAVRAVRLTHERNPRSGPAHRAEPRPRSQFPNSFFRATCSPISSANPHLSSGSSAPDRRFVPVQADGWSVPFVGKPPLRSRKTPSASGRGRLVGVPVRQHRSEIGTPSTKCCLRMATFSSDV